ncbi:SGNH/GDSL hydrolase family protein [Nocardioides sp. zg-ZUI104]|uniref:SGNH/GDSL hydrolase family protein n=1 Tax=Nocardioides faecalis TaxID=2803858 RepID=UPI001BD17862|nr:SGNH/GDSL hydrolase family protein [Nocardioides faecalis]MBS4751747.1 SGNH/GDSL hydrolase family protein [Nocardioides faecalis]
MTRHLTRARLLVGTLAALLVVGVSTVALARAGAGPDRCGVTAERAAARGALVTGEGARVLVIGDSYSVGAGVAPTESWPVRLPGRVVVDGFSGSGFSAGASPCGDRSYATRVTDDAGTRREARATDLVVVEGGLNDTDQPVADLVTGFERLARRLAGAEVLVVGPAPAPARPAEAVAAVDAELMRLAAAHGMDYLSMLDVELGYLDDRLHPDPEGHRIFGDRVAERVRTLLAD